jgi:transposase
VSVAYIVIFINREISGKWGCPKRNGHWLEQKAKVKELLSSEEYKTLMKKRSTECETVFGQTKGNLKFRRFHLRGKEKVGIEWGLLMLGYDFRQLIRLMNT